MQAKKKKSLQHSSKLICLNFFDTSEPFLFHDGGPYHIETSRLICRVNQWTVFYMIGTSFMKELIL